MRACMHLCLFAFYVLFRLLIFVYFLYQFLFMFISSCLVFLRCFVFSSNTHICTKGKHLLSVATSTRLTRDHRRFVGLKRVHHAMHCRLGILIRYATELVDEHGREDVLLENKAARCWPASQHPHIPRAAFDTHILTIIMMYLLLSLLLL